MQSVEVWCLQSPYWPAASCDHHHLQSVGRYVRGNIIGPKNESIDHTYLYEHSVQILRQERVTDCDIVSWLT